MNVVPGWCHSATQAAFNGLLAEFDDTAFSDLPMSRMKAALLSARSMLNAPTGVAIYPGFP